MNGESSVWSGVDEYALTLTEYLRAVTLAAEALVAGDLVAITVFPWIVAIGLESASLSLLCHAEATYWDADVKVLSSDEPFNQSMRPAEAGVAVTKVRNTATIAIHLMFFIGHNREGLGAVFETKKAYKACFVSRIPISKLYLQYTKPHPKSQ